MQRGKIVRNRRLIVLVLGTLAVAGFALPASSDPLTEIPVPVVQNSSPETVKPAAASEELVGLFEIKKGACGTGSGQGVTAGSYFKMFDPGGQPVTNNDSACGDKNFTPLSPGTDGGLATGGYQPHPDPAFDKPVGGNGLNAKITQPQSFFGTKFSVATNPKDPQIGANVVAPTITHDGNGKLAGDLRSFAAAWQSVHFNQGSPKPDGSKPGETSGPSGSFNLSNASYTLEWKSLIKSNQGQSPFENFTGFWHLEGNFASGVKPPGVQAPRASGGGSRARGRSLSATGPAFPLVAGPALLALGVGGLVLDALLGRRARRRRDE
jgi:hypothetical protein